VRRRAVKGGEKDKKEKDQKVYFLAKVFHGTNWTEKRINFLDFLTIMY
jgi:hypothetical protein